MANLNESYGELEQPRRFVSIDALRGFDMFWILGADALAHAIPKVTDQHWAHVLSEQLEHVPWDGFHFYDLIFPLFVFLMGVSTVFSLDKIVATKGKGSAYVRIFRRGIILYLLGIFYHGGLIREAGDLEQFRYVGVLHRIAICYVIGAVLYMNVSWKGLIAIAAGLLIGYWALLTFVPVPGHGAANWNEGTNLANYVDTQALPGYKWDGDWDPEGLLSTLPAVVSGILGIFGGLLMRNTSISNMTRFMSLLALGGACICVGYGWHNAWQVAEPLWCPIVKKLWSPSFVLYAGGWSFIMLAVFHLIIDIAKFDIWARPFVWIGMNPITLYMLNNLVSGYDSLAARIALDHWMARVEPWGELGVAVAAALIPVWIAWLMSRNKAFLRV